MKLASLALAATLVAGTALAQAPLDSALRQATVAAAAKALRDGYVFPETGAKAAERIEAQLAAGAYDQIAEPRAFADRLTDDLRAVTHDKHLRVMATGGPPPGPPPGMAPPPRNEIGIVRADRLAGGVGYIEIVGFPPPGAFKAALDRAMATLADSKALIVDIRRNGGGSPDSVAYLVSYFVDPAKPMLVNDFVARRTGTPEFNKRSTYSSPTPVSFRGRPLYVLTSPRTFSGGEEFAFDVKAFKLGQLVGEPTGGGAHTVGVRPLNPQFAMGVPDGRPINPVIKTDWEGVGVAPDVAVPAADALKAALRRLGQAPVGGDVDALSQARLFTPRTLAQAGGAQAVTTLVERLAKGEPAMDLLSPDFAKAMQSPGGAAQVAATHRMIAALGPLKAVEFVDVGPQGLDRYTVRFDGGALDAAILMNADGKVETVSFNPPAPRPQAAR